MLDHHVIVYKVIFRAGLTTREVDEVRSTRRFSDGSSVAHPHPFLNAKAMEWIPNKHSPMK